MTGWGGRRAQAWAASVLDAHRDPDGLVRCWLKLPGCTGIATTGDHVIPRAERPDLQYLVDNGRPACLSCNRRRGASPATSSALVVDDRDFFESRAPSRTDLHPTFLPDSPGKPDQEARP